MPCLALIDSVWLLTCFMNKVWNKGVSCLSKRPFKGTFSSVSNSVRKSVRKLVTGFSAKTYQPVYIHVFTLISSMGKTLFRSKARPAPGSRSQIPQRPQFWSKWYFQAIFMSERSHSLFPHIILCSADLMREQKYTLCPPHVKGVLGSHMEWEFWEVIWNGSDILIKARSWLRDSHLSCVLLPIAESVEFVATWESETATLFWFKSSLALNTMQKKEQIKAKKERWHSDGLLYLLLVKVKL